MLDVGPVDLYLCTSLADSKSLPFYEVNVLFFPLYSAGFYWSFFPPFYLVKSLTLVMDVLNCWLDSVVSRRLVLMSHV